MLSLPPSSSPLRHLFDVQDLADRRYVAYNQARKSAQVMFTYQGEQVRAVEVNTLAVRSNGMLELVAFDRNGGHKTLWEFGSVK